MSGMVVWQDAAVHMPWGETNAVMADFNRSHAIKWLHCGNAGIQPGAGFQLVIRVRLEPSGWALHTSGASGCALLLCRWKARGPFMRY